MSRKKALLSFVVIFGLIFGIQTALAQSDLVYPITVNYDLSLSEMIKAGHYDWVNQHITSEHFPVNGTDIKEVVTELVHFNHFNRYMEFKDMLRELEELGLRPATIEELLAFGAKYPKLQRQFFIVALGSVWRPLDGRSVPYLWGHSSERYLDLRWFGNSWSTYCRFLAIRK